MKFEFKPSFDRSVKSLPSETKQEIKELCINLIDMLSSGRRFSTGLGLKNLIKNFWEVRKGLRLRILSRWKGDFIEFMLAWTHEDIKNFLKR